MKIPKKKCIVCGFDKGLEINHMNYDHDDNFPLNLEPICKYCHSLAHYMGKNLFDRMTANCMVDSDKRAAIRRISDEFYRENF